MSPRSWQRALRLSHLGGLPGAVLVGLVVLGVGGATTGALLAAKATVPAPTLTATPAASTTATGATFAFTDSATGVIYQCQLDAAAFTTCSSPKAYTGLAQGDHAFQVRALKSGDQSALTTYAWTIDLTAPPAPGFSTKPPNPSSSTSATFGFTDGEAGVSYLCRLDTAAAFTTCTNPQALSGLTQGSHTLAVKAKDTAGNVGDAASYTWAVDLTPPPAPVLVQKPSDPAVGATQAFTWTDSEAGVSFQCAAENGIYVACATPYTYVVDTNNSGQHQFAVRAVDAAGNFSAGTYYSFKVTKDSATTGMPFTITGSASGLTMGLWRPVTVRVTNPNPVPIYVTSLTVSPSSDSSPSGCLSSNLQLQQPNLSSTNPLTVPANASVDLPTSGTGAALIRLQNLSTNQDICKNKTFALTFSGTANN